LTGLCRQARRIDRRPRRDSSLLHRRMTSSHRPSERGMSAGQTRRAQDPPLRPPHRPRAGTRPAPTTKCRGKHFFMPFARGFGGRAPNASVVAGVHPRLGGARAYELTRTAQDPPLRLRHQHAPFPGTTGTSIIVFVADDGYSRYISTMNPTGYTQTTQGGIQ